MAIDKRLFHWSLFSLFLIVLFGLNACTPKLPSVETPLPPSVNEVTPTGVVTTTQDEPAVIDEQPSVLLVLSPEADSFTKEELIKLLENLTVDSALDLVVKNGINDVDLNAGTKIVIGLGEGLSLDLMAASAPQVPFVVMGDSNAVAANNLSVIGNPRMDTPPQVFMAGYLSALISKDSRVAGIFSANNSVSEELAEKFNNGVRFYCGICNPVLPPYSSFPRWEFIPVGATEIEFSSVIDGFESLSIEVLFVQREVVTTELLDYIAQTEIAVVSDQSPDVIRGNWAGTVLVDPVSTLEAVWLDLINGTITGAQIPTNFVIVDTEMGLIKEGRFRLFYQTLADLNNGLISIDLP